MAIKGYHGAVNGVTNVAKWELTQKATPNPAANSGSKGHVAELSGTQDWEGYYVAHGHTPGTNPGGALTFKGTLDQAVDTNMTAEGTAMVERWRIDWDYENNRPITHTVWFGANGTAITYASTAIADAGPPTWFMSNDPSTKVELGTAVASPVYTELCGVAAAALTCWSEVEPYANSCSNNIMKRAAGNVSWMVDLAIQPDVTNTLKALNGENAVKLYVTEGTPDLYWEVKWVRWKELGPLEVEVQGRKLVTIQYRGMGSGWINISGTWTEGALTNPAGTKVWVPA